MSVFEWMNTVIRLTHLNLAALIANFIAFNWQMYVSKRDRRLKTWDYSEKRAGSVSFLTIIAHDFIAVVQLIRAIGAMSLRDCTPRSCLRLLLG
jgi:TctA family transporter